MNLEKDNALETVVGGVSKQYKKGKYIVMSYIIFIFSMRLITFLSEPITVERVGAESMAVLIQVCLIGAMCTGISQLRWLFAGGSLISAILFVRYILITFLQPVEDIVFIISIVITGYEIAMAYCFAFHKGVIEFLKREQIKKKR